MNNQLKGLCAAIAIAFAGQASATTTWTLASNYGTISSGVTVSALANTGGSNNYSGAANNGATQTIQNATWKNTWGGIANADACSSGRYCDVNEGVNPEHAIDNEQRYDMALLSFASAVRLSEMRLGWVSGDSDVTVMAYQGIGTPSLIGKTFGQLISLGWASVGNYSDLGTSTKSINSAGLFSSYWLVGAYNPLANPSGGGVTGGSTSYDYVKLASVGGCIAGVPGCTPPGGQAPEPGSLALFGIGLLGMMTLRRRTKS
ncbi:MAG: exosortase-dependent surface protein XDP1 [Propionivibrio sp.]